MYVKALLKIFEYATNIKKEKTRTNEEHERYGKLKITLNLKN